jgi:hypothetical protein
MKRPLIPKLQDVRPHDQPAALVVRLLSSLNR